MRKYQTTGHLVIWKPWPAAGHLATANIFAKDLGHRASPRKHTKSLAEFPQSFLRPASTPKKQFKSFKSLEAFNQIMSGFVTSVSRQSNRRQVCREGKFEASVRHFTSVWNDDPFVNTDLRHLRKRWDYFVSPLLLYWCKAGLDGSHIASV